MANNTFEVQDGRQEQAAFRPTDRAMARISNDGYAAGSNKILEQSAIQNSNSVQSLLQPVSFFDSTAPQQSQSEGSALSPTSSVYSSSDATTTPTNSIGGDAATSLMNLFAQQDQMIASNPNDSGLMSFMAQQDQYAFQALGLNSQTDAATQTPIGDAATQTPTGDAANQTPTGDAASQIQVGDGTSNILPINETSSVLGLPPGVDTGGTQTQSGTDGQTQTGTDGQTQTTGTDGQTIPTVGDALKTGLTNPIGGAVELGMAAGLPQPASPDAVGNALKTGLKNPVGGLVELGQAAGLPQPESPSQVASALKTGYTNPKAGLEALGLPDVPLPNVPAPATVVSDVKTGLSNPSQGLIDLSNDLNPFNW